MDFDRKEDERIDRLKQEYGIKQTTELIRFLIAAHDKQISPKEAKISASTHNKP